MRTIFAVLLSILSLGYFLPTTIALVRKRTNTGAIFALNIFAFVGGIPWIIALVWAVAVDSKSEQASA